MKFKSILSSVLAFLFFLVLFPQNLHAQYSGDLAAVSGTVVWGAENMSIPAGSAIEFVGSTTGFSYRIGLSTSSYNSNYILPADTYTVNVLLSYGGGTTYIAGTQTVTLGAGQTATANFDLSTTTGLVKGNLTVNGAASGGMIQFCNPSPTAPCPTRATTLPDSAGPWFTFGTGGFSLAILPGDYRAHVVTFSGVDMGIIPAQVTIGQIINLAYSNVTPTPVPSTPTPVPTATPTPTPVPTYSITGVVFVDTNQNGFQDTDETGYAGAVVTLNTSQTATSDSNGNYTFPELAAGTYTETLTLPNGYTATTTNPATISLSANTTQNFGIALAGPTLVTAINSGGDTQGSYLADTDYAGGTQYTSSGPVDISGVTNPAPQAVYQSVRYGNFSYTIPNLTPNGTYTVRLHFNELYWGTALSGNSGGQGSRVFNVSINGTQVLTNYDIYQKAGGSNIATTEQFSTTPDANGNVTIQFATVTDNAMVNGIEVYNGTLPSPTPTPTPTPVTSAIINAGGNTVGSFSADQEYSGGTTYASTASVDTGSITNPAPEAVYQSVRYGNFTYTIPNLTPNTNFLVRLHFNELYWGTPLSSNLGGVGSRVFNVSINGQQVLSNFDIFATMGGTNRALVEDFVKSSDSTGKITIQFTTVTDNAMVNGIEIIPPSVPTPTYFTANNGSDFSRLTSPFVSGVATQVTNANGSVTINVNSAPGYADSGFVLYEGTLGNLPNFTTTGTGNQYSLNLWLDTGNNNEFFAWDGNGIMTGLDGDTYALSSGSQNGVENINGATNFYLMSDGQNHSLADLKNGLVSGINANTKVAVWIGVNANSGSTSSTIQSVNGL